MGRRTHRWVLLAAFAAVGQVSMAACAFDPHQEEPGQPVLAGAPTGASAPSGIPPSAPAPTTSAPAAPSPKATSPAPPASKAPPKPTGCAQGEKQRDVETYLRQLGGFGPVTVDGLQSAADCLAIKKFQQRYGIRPAEGRAGATTADVARRLAQTRTADCAAGSGTTICVNLTLQTVWVIKGGKVALGPTPTRTGMRGFATPAGTFTVGRVNLKEWSVPYKVWLPYWQQFYQGDGFHETTTYLHDGSIGSHGCVNLLHADAVALWNLAGVGTRVHLFGRRPGT